MYLVKDLMTENPACCNPETTLESVARKMRDFDCGEIPVLDIRNQIIGVVTDRDITCRIVAEGKNALELHAKDCMSTSCVTVDEDATIEECCNIMEAHQVRRLPVINKQGRCRGIISQADIALKATDEKVSRVLSGISRTHERANQN